MPHNTIDRTCLLLVCLISLSCATLGPRDSKTKAPKPLKIRNGPVADSVFTRDLVNPTPKTKEILIESGAYYQNTSARRFDGITLGYVTPWNNHGYDVAKIWAQKFSIISPVWLQIQRTGKQKYEIKGTHDVDVQWMNDVRKAGAGKTKIFPRVLFERNDYIKDGGERQAISEALLDAALKYNFDGYVLELWLQIHATEKQARALVKEIGIALKKKDLEAVLVVPAPYVNIKKGIAYPSQFTIESYDELRHHILAFSFVTYDYSSVQNPAKENDESPEFPSITTTEMPTELHSQLQFAGPNSPLPWLEHVIKQYEQYKDKSNVLIGLNIYGMDYAPEGGGPITGNGYLELLKQVDLRLTHDTFNEEQFFEANTNTGRHYVFYPTLYSINKRIELAQQHGVGLALWELGQGLDYFYDLF